MEQEHLCEERRSGNVQSLVRAFGLLDALGEAEAGLTLSEAAGLVKLPRSTVHRLFTTMSSSGYVDFDSSSNRWQLGLRAMNLGSNFDCARDIGRLGRTVMRSVLFEANAAVNIAVMNEAHIRYVDQIKPAGYNADIPTTGVSLPAHATASGKIMLAYQDLHKVDDFLSTCRLNPQTRLSIIEKSAFLRELQVTRRRGFAIDDQENRIGTRCVATPIFDRNGEVKASLSISGDSRRLPMDRLVKLGPSLVGAANRLSGSLGGLLAA